MAQPQTRRATWRLGARERVRLQTLVIGVIVLLLILVFRPIVLLMIQIRDLQTCQTNVHKISRAITQYREDWDDVLPLAETWMNTAGAFVVGTSGTGFSAETHFHCPRDKSGSPSSYAYNDLLSGLSLSIRTQNTKEEEIRRKLRRPDRAALVIEKHGSPRNAHLPLANWDDVRAAMT
ncbi:MAG TPA: hypothetical protein VNJ09_05010, partial [Chthonomonadales bacterium]|nr:hypothetical protein [Chthonomonadales bacterium]